MRSLLASVRRADGCDRLESAVRSLEDQWRHGEPTLERHWADHDPDQDDLSPGGAGQGRSPLPLRPGRPSLGQRISRALPRTPRQSGARAEPDLRGVLPPRGAGRAARRRELLRPLCPLARFARLAIEVSPIAQPGRWADRGGSPVSRARRTFPGIRHRFGAGAGWSSAGLSGAERSAWRPPGGAEGLTRSRSGAVDHGAARSRAYRPGAQRGLSARDPAPRPDHALPSRAASR